MARAQPTSLNIVLIVLGLVALIGFGQALSHALTAPRPQEQGPTDDAGRDPIPLAKALGVGGPSLDEARIRAIAREEAEAAITRSHPAPKKVAPKDDADDAGDDAASPAAAEAPKAPVPLSPPPAEPQGLSPRVPTPSVTPRP